MIDERGVGISLEPTTAKLGGRNSRCFGALSLYIRQCVCGTFVVVYLAHILLPWFKSQFQQHAVGQDHQETKART